MIQDNVAISGISGRFPQCSNMEELKTSLLDSIDLITNNHRRWPHKSLNLPSRLGLINDLQHFDCSFFGMSPKQADSSDPRCRKLLEVVFETIVDAGVNPSTLRGSNTGVFLAITPAFNDNSADRAKASILSRSMALVANSISYFFDFKGPSYALDTGCSSSLYALSQAFDAVQRGQCDSAIVCTAQTHWDPGESVEFASLGVMNSEGKCKTFDDDRNGYVKSEGVIAVLLQKFEDCKRVYATIAGAGTNVDGYKAVGMNHPSSTMQLGLLKKIYDDHEIDRNDVTYVEAHGTGTKVGDVEEARAIVDFFFQNDRKHPLLVGSVKTNAGHSETASGLMALAKVLISVQCGVIPANLHYNHPASDVPGIQDGRLKVVSKNTPFEGGLIGINSFGFGGANSHVILRPFTIQNNKKSESSHRLIGVSGRTESAVKLLIDKVEENKTNAEFLTLVDSIFDTPIENHKFRSYAVLSSETKQETMRVASKRRPIWFVYSGMGSQWPGMGKDLMKVQVFRETMKMCAEAVKPYGVDLEDIIVNGSEEVFDDPVKCFTAITAMAVCLTEVLFSLGVVPEGIIGHSLGEIGCAYGDGLLTVEQALQVGYGRGWATVNTKLIPGLMAAVGLSLEECEKCLPTSIYVACDNCQDNITISGPEADVRQFCQELTQQKIFNKIINTSNIAFHSKYIADAGPKLLGFLEKVLPERKLRSKRWLPSAIPKEDWASSLGRYHSAQYHHHNFVSRVEFRQVLEQVPSDAVLIEIAPRGLLQAIISRSLDSGVLKLSLSNHQVNDNFLFFLHNVGKMHNAGLSLNLKSLNPPTPFPVSIDTPSISSLVKWDHSKKWSIPQYNPQLFFGETITIDTTDSNSEYLEGHVVDGKILYPATGYLVLAWKTFAKMKGESHEQLPVIIENVKILRATVLSSKTPTCFVANIFQSTGEFEICNKNVRVATGKISLIPNEALKINSTSSDVFKWRMKTEDFYKELHLRGYDYSGIFRGVLESDLDGKRAVLKWYGNWITFIDTILHHVVMTSQTGLFVPTKIERITIDPIEHLKTAGCNSEIKLDYDKELEVAICGGIEVKKLQGVNLKRHNFLGNGPTLQKYQFVPQQTQSDENSLAYSLTVSTQIVIENTTDHSMVKIAEIDNSDSVMDVIKTVICKSCVKSVVFTKIDGNCQKDEEFFDLLIIPDVTQQSDRSILHHVRSSKFLFTQLSEDNTEFFKLFELSIVYKHVTKSGTYVLFRSYQRLPEDYAVILASNTNFRWIEDFKMAVEKYKVASSRIYVINDDHDSGVIGFFNSVRKEQNVSNLRIFYLKNATKEPFSTRSSFYVSQLLKDLTVNVFQDESWGSYRLLPLAPPKKQLVEEATFLSIETGRDIGLHWVQKSPFKRKSLRKVFVHFASVTKWDVSKIGQGHVGDVSIGLEYSGVDASGKKVMGITETGALSTSVNAHPKLTWTIPRKWSLEDAATVPLAYTLSYYALIVRAQMSSKDSLLIHNGTSDVSIAAITLALNKGCQVYVTVNNQKKREFLSRHCPGLDNNNIILQNFDKVVMEKSQRKGVSMVFNCKTEAVIKSSIACSSEASRFIEIGTTITDAAIAEAFLSRNCCFHNVTVFQLWGENNNCVDDIFNKIEFFLKIGIIKPLPRISFGKNQIENALKSLKNDDNIGKNLVKIAEVSWWFSKVNAKILAITRTYMDPEKSYVIIGGLGGFGLELANWLVNRGATKIVLNSRNGVSTGYQAFCLQKWKRRGIAVLTDSSDTRSSEGAENLLNFASNLGSVGGIFNTALVLKDEIITQQTTDNFQSVASPKILTTQNLDFTSRKLCPNLDFFVVFSSMVASLGNATQSNYGFANSAMERLCESRKLDGLPALAVEWGPVGDVGFVSRLKTSVKFLNAAPQPIGSCLEVLDGFLQQSEVVVSSCLYVEEDLVTRDTTKTLLKAVAGFFEIKNVEELDGSTTLLNLGIDSLTKFEIKHLMAKYGIEVNDDDIAGLSVENLRKVVGKED